MLSTEDLREGKEPLPESGSGVLTLLREERELEADLARLAELQLLVRVNVDALVLLARLVRDVEILVLLVLRRWLADADRERDLSVLFR